MRKTTGAQKNKPLSLTDTAETYEIINCQDVFAEADGANYFDPLIASVHEEPTRVIVFALDRDYRYTSFNKNHKDSMRLIWGKDIAVGMSILEIIGSLEDWLTAKAEFDRALFGESFTHLRRYGDDPRSRIYWQNYWAPIRDSKGQIIGLSCFSMNLTNESN